ncbi:Gfo/Idh/MocA family protein [Echinicola shivajiensis]|uniref:Gfo/Idh/MocA family protein n=1 Tax=Echinicola shivajiensis TaxID=1035916 RepID=UPI001BFCC960|nr:Gfo/Idh/MocA family oxidoreductase [Echinicola shivajiensis]
MRQIVKFGIIGTGAIAAQHAAAIAASDTAELIAVCSSSEDRAKSAGKKFKVAAYDDLDKFLGNPELDAVCICTASGRHMEVAIKSAQYKKHILVEKPIEINLDRADRIIEACKENGVVLGVVFQNRFNDGYLQLKKAVVKGKLGRLLMGNAHVNWFRNEEYYKSSDWKGTLRGDGGGALINQGIHTIDLLLDIMGEVEDVYGQVKTAMHTIEGEDLASALINFKNGAMGNITAGTSLYPGYPERLEIFGTKGSVILEAGKIIAWNVQDGESLSGNSNSEKASGAADPMAIGHQLHFLLIEDMVSAIRENREPLITGEIAKQSLALIKGIYKSSSEGRKIKI